MRAIAIVLVGVVAGLATMTALGFYKWFLNKWNRKTEGK